MRAALWCLISSMQVEGKDDDFFIYVIHLRCYIHYPQAINFPNLSDKHLGPQNGLRSFQKISKLRFLGHLERDHPIQIFYIYNKSSARIADMTLFASYPRVFVCNLSRRILTMRTSNFIRFQLPIHPIMAGAQKLVNSSSCPVLLIEMFWVVSYARNTRCNFHYSMFLGVRGGS